MPFAAPEEFVPLFPFSESAGGPQYVMATAIEDETFQNRIVAFFPVRAFGLIERAGLFFRKFHPQPGRPFRALVRAGSERPYLDRHGQWSFLL